MDSKNCKITIICVGNKSREIADYLHEENIPGATVAKCVPGTSEESIKSLLDDQPDLVVIFTSPVGMVPDNTPLLLARTVKEAGIVSIGIVTMPFLCEGEKTILRALDFAMELSKYTDTMMTINMENIVGLTELHEFSVLTPLRPVVKLCSQQLRNLADLMDSEESKNSVKYALKDSRIFYTGRGEGKGDAPVAEAIYQTLHKSETLIKSRDFFDFKSSTKCIFKIFVNEKIGSEASIFYLKELYAFTIHLPCSCDIAISFEGDSELDEGVKIIMLLTSFDIEPLDIEAPIPQQKCKKNGNGNKIDMSLSEEYSYFSES